jgi:SAM-dependent methyltransferase
LKLAGFTLDEATGLRIAPGEGIPAGYLDGAEQYLVEGLRRISDRSVGSEELAALVKDWPTEYHLSPFRTTIVDCLGLTGGPLRVLELGCGCGAITRWLGERCEEVHAIEGNAARALAARTRCADLPGVEVYVGNFSELDERDGYDVVTLIGVLEYGHLYDPVERNRPAAAAAAGLRRARDALRTDGVLVLAIENKLGIKYLNGAREDHSGRPYDGIEGYPDPSRSAVTFSARELEGLLASAGFGACEFLLPFPDYKLASTIVNPAECEDEDRIYNWLDGPAPDRGAARARPSFNELLAQREFSRAGLLRDVANSFLILAWPDAAARERDRAGVDLGWRARHYSLDRRRDFRKVVTLMGDRVEHEPVHRGAERPEAAAIEQVLGLSQALGPEPFRRGDLLLYRVLETVAAHGLGSELALHVGELRAWVLEHFAVASAVESVPFVSGDAYDAVWWNLVVDPDTGAWQLIDREWTIRDALPADYVVWRTLYHFALRYGSLVHRSDPAPPAADFADAWVREAAPQLPPWFEAVCRELDAAYGGAVVRGPLPAAEPESLASLRELAQPTAPTVSVLARAEEIIASPPLLAAYGDHFGRDDAATLVVLVDGEVEAVAPAVEAAMRSAGLDDQQGPDVILLPRGDDAAEAGLVDTGLALLSERDQPQPLGTLPRFGAAEVAQLRALAERSW